MASVAKGGGGADALPQQLQKPAQRPQRGAAVPGVHRPAGALVHLQQQRRHRSLMPQHLPKHMAAIELLEYSNWKWLDSSRRPGFAPQTPMTAQNMPSMCPHVIKAEHWSPKLTGSRLKNTLRQIVHQPPAKHVARALRRWYDPLPSQNSRLIMGCGARCLSAGQEQCWSGTDMSLTMNQRDL